VADAAGGAGRVATRWAGPGVLEIVLDRAESANAFDPETVSGLNAALDEAEDGGARRVVIASRGERVFAAGIDLRFTGSAPDAEVVEFFLRLGRLLERIRCAPFTTACLVDGAAVGAGADLAMSCDIRAAGPRASFRFPGRAFGLRLGGNQLARIASAEAAEDIQGSGRKVGLEEAAANGMVTHRVPEAGADPVPTLAGLADDVPKPRRELDYDALGRLADSLLPAPAISARIAEFAASALDRGAGKNPDPAKNPSPSTPPKEQSS
jgi:enoyl-CoA hydratase